MLVLHLLHWWKIPVSNVVLRLCKTVYVGVWVLLSASSAQCCTVHSSFCRSSSYCQYPHSHVTLDRTVARIRSLVCSWFSERFRREGAQSQATAWTKKTSWVLLSAGTINSERGAWGSGCQGWSPLGKAGTAPADSLRSCWQLSLQPQNTHSQEEVC